MHILAETGNKTCATLADDTTFTTSVRNANVTFTIKKEVTSTTLMPTTTNFLSTSWAWQGENFNCDNGNGVTMVATRGDDDQKQTGFTLVELMVTMVIFVLVIAAASSMFTGILNQFKQQSKIAETNIEGLAGLQMFRTDIEQAGYGLPMTLMVLPILNLLPLLLLPTTTLRSLRQCQGLLLQAMTMESMTLMSWLSRQRALQQMLLLINGRIFPI